MLRERAYKDAAHINTIEIKQVPIFIKIHALLSLYGQPI